MATTTIKRSPVLTVIAAIVGALVGSMAVRHYLDRPTTIDRALVMTASQINKNLPMMVDKETRLDSTAAGPDKTIVYRYTLVNRNAADVPKERLVTIMRPQMINNYKTNVDMKSLRDNGVTMEYQYSDKGGSFITSISISPKDF